MKKQTALCVAVAALTSGLSTTAMAQSSVTLYGLVDLGLGIENAGNGNVNRIQSGQWYGSRWGIRGKEDLGGGLSAEFVAEAGFKANDGSNQNFGSNINTNTNSFFDRQIFLGLSGNWGRLTLGRQYTLTDSAKGTVEPFQNGTAGDLTPVLVRNPSRADNAVIYGTPRIGGVQVRAMYSFGNGLANTATTSQSVGREASVDVNYSEGPVYMALAYDQLTRSPSVNNQLNTQKLNTTMFGTSYDLKVVKLHAIINRAQADAAVSRDPVDVLAWGVGATVPFRAGMSEVRFAYGQRNDRTSFDRDMSKWGVGYFHSLSKRTTLYTAYSKLTNVDRFTAAGVANGAGQDLGSGAAAGIALANRNSDPWSFNLGIRHSF